METRKLQVKNGGARLETIHDESIALYLHGIQPVQYKQCIVLAFSVRRRFAQGTQQE